MAALTPHEIEAVRSTIAYMTRFAETLTPSRERGDLMVTADILHELLKHAEEHE